MNDLKIGVLATRRGKLTLAVLCLGAFVVFIDTTIINVALPSIRRELGFSVQNLQWMVSAYLLANGGFLLLGGRLADLVGRRRVLIFGASLLGSASLVGGLADRELMLIAARFVQGLGAALITPAALSILTTTFHQPSDRTKAIGFWSGTSPLAAVTGLLVSGVLTQGPGWRWVFYVNLPFCLFLVLASIRFLPSDDRSSDPKQPRGFDVPGGVLSTAAVLLVIFALVNAPETGWATPSTIGGLGVGVVLLLLFGVYEQRVPRPLVPLAIFRVANLAVADITQMVSQTGFVSVFFFTTLYMQTVLRFSPIPAGVAYLPVTLCVATGAVLSTRFIRRVGERPVLVIGALLGAVGVSLLSRMSVDGSYVTALLPGLVVMGLGYGCVFVGVQTAANAGVSPDKAGLAAALVTASTTLGGALGLAIWTAVATTRTLTLLADSTTPVVAVTGGFQSALLGCAFTLALSAVLAAVAMRRQRSGAALSSAKAISSHTSAGPLVSTYVEPATTRGDGRDQSANIGIGGEE